MSGGRPTVAPTRPQHLVLAAVGVLLVGRLALAWWRDQGGSLPIPGVVAWASVALIAVGIAWLARMTRRTVVRDRASLDPQQAVTRLLLGKTSQVAAALLFGGYAALAWVAADRLPAPLAVERLVHAGAACLACVGWVVAGGLLEAACRVPDDDDDSPDTPTGDGESPG